MFFKLAAVVSTLLSLSGCAALSTEQKAKVDYIETSQGRFAYYQRGQGRPLLMLTGTGSTMSEWDPALLRRLAKNNRLILVDYLGVGLSGKQPQKSFTFADVSDEIAAFLAAKEDRPVTVLGWSMGGFVAQQLAIRHPGQVSKVIIAASNPGGQEAVLGSPQAQRLDSDGNASDREILKELYPRTKRGQREGRAFLRRLETASASGEIPDDFNVSPQIQKSQVRAEDQWLRSEANWNGLKRLSKPLLATAGRADQVTPPLNMRRIAMRAGAGRYQLFPGSHAFLFSDRDNFARAVDRFLND